MSQSIQPRTTTTYHPFGTRLREARLAAGLSLRALAQELGLSHEFLHQVEKGYCKAMRPEYFPLLSSALNVPEEEWKTLLAQTPYSTPRPFYTHPAKAKR